MKCFEIRINGEKVCTAGVGDSGVLNSFVSFMTRKEQDETPNDSGAENLFITVSGIANLEEDASNHLEWLHQDLNVGDEIVIKIIEASSCDEPNSSEVSYLACSFCGKGQAEVVQLVAGPRVFICNECIQDSNATLDSAEPTGKISIIVSKTSEGRCSFCGRQASEVEKIVGVPNARICNECVKICNQILIDTALSEDSPPPQN